MDFQFQNKSKFALLAVNNVYTDLPRATFQLSDGTWVMPGVPVPDLGIWNPQFPPSDFAPPMHLLGL